MKPSNLNLPVLSDEASTTPTDSPSPTEMGRVGDHPLVLELDVVSDVICPWCYVGKRRLEKALALLSAHARVTVAWRPFQLNPSMPKEGIDRRQYRTSKFGSWERSQALDARLAAAGATEGIDFRFDRMTRTPNTLDAHRLIRLAHRLGKQDDVVEALFRAYFTGGTDIGDRESLVATAESVGVDRGLVEKTLASDEGLREVLAEEEKFKALGIEGVPTFVVGGNVLFSGAAEPRLVAEAILRECDVARA